MVDLIGDDLSTPTASNGLSLNGPSTKDLLADIFGSEDSEPTATASAPAQGQSATSDIMNLFNTSPPPTSTPAAAPPSSAKSLFDLVTPSSSAPASSLAQTPSTQASKPQPQTYTAYDQNGLKITLTPRVSPTQPGTVQILARFTSTVQAEGVNFQVAVPKVCLSIFVQWPLTDWGTDTAAANASYVQFGRQPWSDRDTADADHGAFRSRQIRTGRSVANRLSRLK